MRGRWSVNLGQMAAALSRCQVCGRWPAQPVCDACVARWVSQAARCPTCALRLPPGADPRQPCGACLVKPPVWKDCVCVVDYAYPWHHLVQRFKYHHEPAWARTFAHLARTHAPWHPRLLASDDLLLPVPLAIDRLAQRGYNQAERWAHALAQTLTNEPRGPSRHRPHALLRLGHTTEQIGRTRSQRDAAVKAAFMVQPSHLSELRGRAVWLLDDVMTTGATLHAAAQALLRAGVGQVSVACVARTPPPDQA